MSMEIDNENKLREIPVSQPMFLNNFSDKVSLISKEGDHELPFEGPSSTKANFLSNQNDFGLIDHHHHHDNFNVYGSSPNPNVVFQAGSSFDSFDAFTYRSSSSTNIDFYDYDIKPFEDAGSRHQIIEHGQVIDNFQTGGNVGLGGYFPEPNHAIAMHFHDAEPLNFAVPREELSCVRASQDYYKKVGLNNNTNNDNNKHSGGNNSADLNKNNRGTSSYGRSTFERSRKKSSETKGQWIAEEDRLLAQLVEEHGIKKWSVVARMLPGRIGKQCRERWHNHLRPDIKKDTWSEDEDRMLIQAHTEIGNKWAEIAKRLPGRTENSIKNHWNATKRRQYSKRKCRSKYPRGSLLQDYIKNLNLDPSPAAAATATTTEPIPGSNAPDFDHDNANMGSKKTLSEPTEEELDFCMNDRLVPSFDFDEKIFGDSCCNIETLLDDIPYAPVIDSKSFGVDDVPIDDMAPVLVGEGGKKELDLVEMISEAKL